MRSLQLAQIEAGARARKKPKSLGLGCSLVLVLSTSREKVAFWNRTYVFSQYNTGISNEQWLDFYYRLDYVNKTARHGIVVHPSCIPTIHTRHKQVIFAYFLNNLILLSEYGTMNNLTNFEIIVISNLSRLNKISAQLITEEFSISIINIAGTTD